MVLLGPDLALLCYIAERNLKYLFSAQKYPSGPALAHCPPTGVAESQASPPSSQQGSSPVAVMALPQDGGGLWGPGSQPALGEDGVWGMCAPWAVPAIL